MKRLPLIGEERGAALLGALVICILVMSVLVWSLQWSLSAGKSDSHLADTQRALSYADSGINAAAQRLKMPWLNSDSISSFTVSSSLNNGRYEYTVVVDSETHSLADTYATGYFYLGTGDWTDPLNGQKAQRAVVHAKIYFAGIQNLAAAVPGYLPIGGGTVVDGTLYGNDLIFKRSADGTPSRIGTALYHQSAKREDQEADPAPDYVVFNSSPTAAQHVDYPLHFPRLGLAVRRYYSDRAKASFARLNNGASLDGLVSKPGDSPDAVYFCDGDLHLGQVNAFSAQDSFLIYATGAVYIHKPVLLTVGSWVAILAEKDIHITEDAPNPLILKGTYLTNGAILTDGQLRRAGSFHLYGNMIAGQGIDLADYWSSRVYVRAGPLENVLGLPNFTQLLEYKVVQGKYNQ